MQLAQIISAVADGDLAHTVRIEGHQQLQGEYLRLTIEADRMLQTLNTFLEDITQVIKDVGVEGICLLI